MAGTIGLAARVCVILLLAIATACAEEGTYAIRFSRPSQAGERHRIEVVAAESVTNTTTWEGYDPSRPTQTLDVVRLVGDAAVHEVDEHGYGTKESVKVLSFTQLKDQQQEEVQLLEPGKMIVIEQGDDAAVFTVDGEPADDKLVAILNRMVHMSKPEKRFDKDGVFGTSEKRRVGDSWPIDAKAMAESFTVNNFPTRAEDISGEATLAAVETCNGQQCLRIHVTVQIKRFDPKREVNRKMLHGMKLTGASGKMETDFWLPIDADAGSVRVMDSATYCYIYEGRQRGHAYVIDQSMTRELHFRVLPDE